MSVDYELVLDNPALAEAVSLLSADAILAVDTEFIRRDTFFPKPGLIQLANENHCFLVDPLVVTDYAPLIELLCDPDTTKIMHS